jgi:cytochrome P450
VNFVGYGTDLGSPIEKLIPRRWYLQSIKVIEEFILPFIDETLNLRAEELEKITKQEKTFTFLHAMANFTRDPKVIRDQLIAVLLAGRDTTAATLSWTFYEISNYPEIWAKLRREVLDVVGPDREPTYDDLKNLKYLTYTLNETLRLYPSVPFNVRYALSDTSLPSSVPGAPDTTIVAGDAVFYATIGMQRRADLYPPPSEKFAPAAVYSPDRWEGWQPKAWQYVPFNGGPRICVGQNFAMTEMAYVMVRLAQRFERVEYRGNWRAQFHKVEIVGTPGQGVKVALFEAGR